jgi:hypothetical protein
MGSTMKRTVSAAFVVGFVAMWQAETDHDMALAQSRKKIIVQRMFTGPDGRTRIEDIDVTPSGGMSELVKVTGMQFRRTAPNWFSDFHPAPKRQYVITLSGRGEVELEDGKKYPLEPGHIMLAEDLTGKGHISRGVGTEERISIVLPLPD